MELREIITPGLRREESFTVSEAHSAEHLGSGDLRVLATPSMILFMEKTARRLLAEHLPEGYSSVGARVDVRHLAPSPVGAQVRARVEVSQVQGNKVTLKVAAWQGQKMIGKGTHWRVVIDEARFMNRVMGSRSPKTGGGTGNPEI